MTDNTQPDHIVHVHEMVTDTNQASEYQGNEPTYRVYKEKGKYVVRKFVEFDHSWAIYSKPLDTFDTIHGAKEYIRLLELEEEL